MSKRKITRNEHIARKLLKALPSDINCEVTYNRHLDRVETWIKVPMINFKYINFLHHEDSDIAAASFYKLFTEHIDYCKKKLKENRRN